jgi:hypothetical protein
MAKNERTQMNTFLAIGRRVRFVLASTVALVFLANACGQRNEIPDYSVGFLNKTGHDLDEVSAYYSNKLWVLPTPLVATGVATVGPIPLMIPPEAEVRLIDNGEHKSIIISLKDVPKTGFQGGTIYIVINTNDTIEVKPIKSEDTGGAAQLMMSARPAGEYRLGFVNKTGQDLQAVCVYFGNQQAGVGGDILARVKVGYSDPLTLPIPAEAEVRWKENNVDHAIKAKLDGIVPNGYSHGTIYFVIRDANTVEVKPIKWSDSDASDALVR